MSDYMGVSHGGMYNVGGYVRAQEAQGRPAGEVPDGSAVWSHSLGYPINAAQEGVYHDETGEEGLSGYPYDYGYDSGLSLGTEQERHEQRLRMQEDYEMEVAREQGMLPALSGNGRGGMTAGAAGGNTMIRGEGQARGMDYEYIHDEASVDAWLSGSGTFGTAISTPAHGALTGNAIGAIGEMGYDSWGRSGYAGIGFEQDPRYQHQPSTYGPSYPTDFGPSVSILTPTSSSKSRDNVWAFDPASLLIRSRRSPLRSQFTSQPQPRSRLQQEQAMLGSCEGVTDGGFATAPQSQVIENPAVSYESQVQPEANTVEAGSGLTGDPVAESGLDLHRWLAESVWNFCTTPYLPGKPCSPDNSPRPTSHAPQSYDHQGQQTGKHQHQHPWMDVSGQDSGPGMMDWFDAYPSPVHVSPPLSPSPSMLYPNPFGLRQSPSSSFIDFVHRTLSQTLLSPTAVILSLWYIRRFAIHAGGDQEGAALRRMLMASASDLEGRGGEEGVRRVLTLGLACSNKWLDDNTFTNKSWSDVTRLPLPEINRLELLAIAPLSFDLSVQASAWRDWVSEVERQVTPFVTDHRLVLRALGKMANALKVEEERFDVEVVLPRLRVEIADERSGGVQAAYGGKRNARSPTVSPVGGMIGDVWTLTPTRALGSFGEASSIPGSMAHSPIGTQPNSTQAQKHRNEFHSQRHAVNNLLIHPASMPAYAGPMSVSMYAPLPNASYDPAYAPVDASRLPQYAYAQPHPTQQRYVVHPQDQYPDFHPRGHEDHRFVPGNGYPATYPFEYGARSGGMTLPPLGQYVGVTA